MSSSVRWTHIAEHWTASHHGDRRGGGSAPAGGGAAMDAMISFAAKLAGHARTLPDRPAVTCGEDVLTYGELHRRSNRSEEHTSELQSLMRISYAVFCLK